MASYTEHLQLLKKDPVEDGADTFNIQTMLNDNWDKIDEAVAKKAELGADGKVPATQLPAMNYDPAGSAEAVQTNLTNHINNQNNPHDVTAEQLGALAAVAAYYGASTADGVLDTFTDPTAVVYLSRSINPDLWETLEESSWAYVIQIFYNRIDAASTRMQLATGSNGRFAVRYYSSISEKWGNWSAMATADDLDAHINNKNNPHGVTAAQVGARADTWVPSWGEVSGKPGTFPPSGHNHDAANIVSGILPVGRGGTGVTSLSALAAQIAANGGCRIATGSYVGNGLSGESNPTVLQFPFKPKYVTIPNIVNSDEALELIEVYNGAGNPILAVDAVPTGSTYSSSGSTTSGPLGYYTKYRYDNNTNTLYFYSDSSGGALHQQNMAGTRYYWIALG